MERLVNDLWNDVRVADSATLERLCARKGTEGSNPSRSAKICGRVCESKLSCRRTLFKKN